MTLIPSIPLDMPPAALQRGAARIDLANKALSDFVYAHKSGFREFWSDPNETPDEKCAAMGVYALGYLTLAGASIAAMQGFAGAVGKDLTELILPEEWMPKREFVVEMIDGAPTGRISLAPPAEGFDAWGNPIPPDVEPEP